MKTIFLLLLSFATLNDLYSQQGTFTAKYKHRYANAPLAGVKITVGLHVAYEATLEDEFGTWTRMIDRNFALTGETNSEGVVTINGGFELSLNGMMRDLGYTDSRYPYWADFSYCDWWGMSIPGFDSPTMESGWYVTKLSGSVGSTSNLLTIEMSEAALNKSLSDLFYSNKLNFVKDTIRNATGFEIGAPTIRILGENSFTVLIPFYRVTSYVLYSGTASIAISGSPTTMTMPNGEVQFGFRIDGINAGYIIYGNLTQIQKDNIGRTFPAIFIPLTSAANFYATHDAYAYEYVETQQLPAQQYPIFVNPSTLRFTFQSKYASIN